MIGAGIILIICLLIGDITFKACWEYRKWVREEVKREKKEKLQTPISVGEITMEEVRELVENYQFWEMVQEVCEGKDPNNGSMEDTGVIEILQPCIHHDCPSHVTRADCCHDAVIKDGKEYCRSIININKLCGIPDPEKKENPQPLSQDEIEQLSRYILELMKANKVGEFQDAVTRG